MSGIKGWETKRLDEIGQISSGSTPSTTIKRFWDGDIVWVTPYDLARINTPYLEDSSKKITEAGLESCSANLTPPGSLVISSRAPIGYLALPVVDFCTNQGCKSIKLKPQFDSEFTYYNVLFNIECIKSLGEGTTFAEISKAALSTVTFDFPESKPEQAKIAEVLSTVDRAIEQTEALIAKQQRIKAGLLQDLLTRGIDEHGNLRSETTHAFKDSPLGRIPVEWEFTTCECVCEKIIDCKNRTPPEFPEGFPVIRTPNVRDGQFVDEGLLYTDERSYLIWTQRGRPAIGDIVITREAPVGEVCMIPDRHPKACLGQRMMLYRPAKEKISSLYLLYCLQSSPIQNHLDLISGGSTVGHVRVGDIRELGLIMPSRIDEQDRIALSLEKHFEQDKNEREYLSKLRSLKTALMQDLLTGRKRVTALLNDSREEIATVP